MKLNTLRQLAEDLIERGKEATQGPWLAKVSTHHFRGELRDVPKCAGIIRAHSHAPEADCYYVDDCPAHEGEIVTTDSGFYGPDMPTAEFIVTARESDRLAVWALEVARTVALMDCETVLTDGVCCPIHCDNEPPFVCGTCRTKELLNQFDAPMENSKC